MAISCDDDERGEPGRSRTCRAVGERPRAVAVRPRGAGAIFGKARSSNRYRAQLGGDDVDHACVVLMRSAAGEGRAEEGWCWTLICVARRGGQ